MARQSAKASPNTVAPKVARGSFNVLRTTVIINSSLGSGPSDQDKAGGYGQKVLKVTTFMLNDF
jgi:hypothetical protein